MRIEKFKRWFQVKNADGFTVAQFLTENEANVFIGCSSSFPRADQKLGKEAVHQRRGQTIKHIKVYPA